MTLTLRARVRDGRLVLDEPSDLPEGSELDLVPANDGDEMDEADRARLHAAIDRSAEQFRQGPGVPAAEVLRKLGETAAK